MKLLAPDEYWELTPEQKKMLCNGCGPKLPLISWLIPETCWFCDIREACHIHDFMYHIGETPKDKEDADKAFLINMYSIIEAQTKNKWLKKLRKIRARNYYRAVRDFGRKAFTSGKLNLD